MLLLNIDTETIYGESNGTVTFDECPYKVKVKVTQM